MATLKRKLLLRVLSWLATHGPDLLMKAMQQIKQFAAQRSGQPLGAASGDSRVQQVGQLVESFVLVEIFSQNTSLNRWLDLRRIIEAQQLPLDTAQQQLSQLQGSVEISERFAGFLAAYMQTHGAIQPPAELLLQRIDQAVYQYGLNSTAAVSQTATPQTAQAPLYATHYRKNKQQYYAVYAGWVYEWDATARYYFPVSDLEFASVAAFLSAAAVQVVKA